MAACCLDLDLVNDRADAKSAPILLPIVPMLKELWMAGYGISTVGGSLLVGPCSSFLPRQNEEVKDWWLGILSVSRTAIVVVVVVVSI